MKEIRIRYATINDFPFIVDCQLKMAQETENLELNKEIVTAGVQAVFDDPLKGFYIVGEQIVDTLEQVEIGNSGATVFDQKYSNHPEASANGWNTAHDDAQNSQEKLCSCLMITPEWSDWRNNNVWWIQSVFVLPEYREAGVFKMMYSFIKSLVTERQDIAGIRLYVDNTNLKAQGVYKRMGMTDEHYRVFEWMKEH